MIYSSSHVSNGEWSDFKCSNSLLIVLFKITYLHVNNEQSLVSSKEIVGRF